MIALNKIHKHPAEIALSDCMRYRKIQKDHRWQDDRGNLREVYFCNGKVKAYFTLLNGEVIEYGWEEISFERVFQ